MAGLILKTILRLKRKLPRTLTLKLLKQKKREHQRKKARKTTTMKSSPISRLLNGEQTLWLEHTSFPMAFTIIVAPAAPRILPLSMKVLGDLLAELLERATTVEVS